MIRKIFALFASMLLAGLVAASEFVEVGPAVVQEGVSLGDWRIGQFNDFVRLREAIERFPEAVAARIELTGNDVRRLRELSRDSVPGTPRVVGLVLPVDLEVDFTLLRTELLDDRPLPLSHGWIRRTQAGELTWSIRVDAANTGGVRLHLTDLRLPEGVSVYLLNGRGDVRGPYRGDGESLWTHSIPGEQIYLQIMYPRLDVAALRQTRFRIAEALTLDPSPQAFCDLNADCVVDGSCYDSDDWGFIDNARRAVANIVYVDGGFGYACSGGLVNSTDGSGIPYFLTANHCVSTQTVANTVETRFDFRTDSCGAACFWPNTFTTRGATLLSTASSNDHTLLRLSGNPPSGAVLLGWTTQPIADANGQPLHRLSHPKSAPQAYSQQNVDSGAAICLGYPRGRYIYSRNITGATEPGSSGSPVLNAAGQVVGHLYGVCGSNITDPCDSTNNRTVDGAFANYFSSVAPWLNPGSGSGGGACPSSALLSAREDSGTWFSLLYGVRDEVLPRLAHHAWLRDSYYRHGAEVTGLILEDPALQAQAMDLLDRLRPAFEAALAGAPLRLSQEEMNAVLEFAQALRQRASPELSSDLALLRQRAAWVLMREMLTGGNPLSWNRGADGAAGEGRLIGIWTEWLRRFR